MSNSIMPPTSSSMDWLFQGPITESDFCYGAETSDFQYPVQTTPPISIDDTDNEEIPDWMELNSSFDCPIDAIQYEDFNNDLFTEDLPEPSIQFNPFYQKPVTIKLKKVFKNSRSSTPVPATITSFCPSSFPNLNEEQSMLFAGIQEALQEVLKEDLSTRNVEESALQNSGLQNTGYYSLQTPKPEYVQSSSIEYQTLDYQKPSYSTPELLDTTSIDIQKDWYDDMMTEEGTTVDHDHLQMYESLSSEGSASPFSETSTSSGSPIHCFAASPSNSSVSEIFPPEVIIKRKYKTKKEKLPAQVKYLRKKEQNREAALRYRMKKKNEDCGMMKQINKEKAKKEELTANKSKVEQEITFMKKLFKDLLKKRNKSS